MTKITVRDEHGKQLVVIEFDTDQVQEIRIGSPNGTIEITGGEPEQEGDSSLGAPTPPYVPTTPPYVR